MVVSNDVFVVEYSVSQDAFHVQTVKEMLSTNRDTAIGSLPPVDYLPVFFAATRTEANEFATAFRAKLKAA